jgi:glucoamylase
MLFTSILRALPAALLLSGTQGTPVGELESRQATVDAFVKSQTTVSINGVLANIGGGGSKAPGVSAGIVVASPSRSDPDCKCKPFAVLKVS